MFSRTESRSRGNNQTVREASSLPFCRGTNNDQPLPDSKRFGFVFARESFQPIARKSLNAATEFGQERLNLSFGRRTDFDLYSRVFWPLDYRKRAAGVSAQPFCVFPQPL
jgi:hypothetical protein